MNIIKPYIKGLLVIEPDIFEDERGYFFESFNEKKYAEIGILEKFVQDNQSFSKKGTIRGLHYQVGDFSQGKLVRVVSGSVIDYAVDIRFGSPTFGKYIEIELSSKNQKQMWIPIGFAHGFEAIEDNTILEYKCTSFYSKEHERSIIYNDSIINIQWKEQNPIVSKKDLKSNYFKDIKKDFFYEK